MVDFLRLILPKLITAFIIIAVLWLVIYLLKKHVFNENDDEGKSSRKTLGSVGRITTLLVVIIYIINFIYIASINSVPRSTIDHSTTDKMGSAFEEQMIKNANTPRQFDSTKIDTIFSKTK